MIDSQSSADPRPPGSLIVLDRDGVINRDSREFIKTPEEWIPLPGSPEAIARLNEAGFTVVVATNQSGLGRGIFSAHDLEKIHNKMKAVVTQSGGHIDAIFICPHGPDERCDCRKPEPGLLKQIARRYGRSPSDMIVVGDSMRDLEAARAFGAPACLVRTGNGRITEQRLPPERRPEVYDDLAALAGHLTA